MRRVVYLFLPNWPIDRRRRAALLPSRSPGAAPAENAPFATVVAAQGRQLLAAVNPAAAAAGLAPGMPLADALSFLPGLATAAAEPARDAAALRRLAEWCGRYSPWTAPDGGDGVKIEITGAAHLRGGERALAADLARRLAHPGVADRGIAHRIAIAGTLGAAWALARFAAGEGEPAILPEDASPEAAKGMLAPLPVEALRLDPAIAAGLRRVGLKRIGELHAMPRDALARRFGESVRRRLDQALGDLPEPLSPMGEAPLRRVRLGFAEPIADPADLARAAERLAADLVCRLAREGMGARRLDLAFYRVDSRVEHIRLGIARPSRDPRHLAGLLRARLDTIDPGLGIEEMILAAFAAEPLPPEQIGPLGGDPGDPAATGTSGVAALLDRLAVRLGDAATSRLEARSSHVPERASVNIPVSARPERAEKPGAKPPRPLRLFAMPQPIDAFWLLPDDPPFRFVWRRRQHRVRRADGPERIAAEWWRPADADAAIRDYYRVEDEEGRRFWLFRSGSVEDERPPRWFVHGVFA